MDAFHENCLDSFATMSPRVIILYDASDPFSASTQVSSASEGGVCTVD